MMLFLFLLSDAIESIVNVIASFVTVIALHLSNKPADSRHHYGHYKLEYFSAFFEGCIIIIASFMIFKELGDFLNKPQYETRNDTLGATRISDLRRHQWHRSASRSFRLLQWQTSRT